MAAAQVAKNHVDDFFSFFVNWNSLYARLNSHYEACSYKKKMNKKIKTYRKFV